MFFLCVIFVLYKKGFWEFKEVTLKFKEVTQDSLQNDPWGFSGAQKYDHNFDYIDLFWWFFLANGATLQNGYFQFPQLMSHYKMALASYVGLNIPNL